MTQADPFVSEKIVALLSTSAEPMFTARIGTALGPDVYPSMVRAALKQVEAEGLAEQTAQGGYVATDEARRRYSASLDAEMQDDAAQDADAMVASMGPAMTVDPDDVVYYESLLLDEEEALVAGFYRDHGDDIRSALVASMHELNPAPLSGWVASAKFALEDHRAKPSLNSALRARRMLRKAIATWDPAALPPLDAGREQALTAALAPRRAPRQKEHSGPPDGCCGTCNQCKASDPPGLTGKAFR